MTFLTYMVRMAQPGVTPEQKTKLKQELYETIKPMYIMQCLTAVSGFRRLRFFSARVDIHGSGLWAIQYDVGRPEALPQSYLEASYHKMANESFDSATELE